MTAPFFVHVDCDDLWAIAACYGVPLHPTEEHAVLLDALPRYLRLFKRLQIRATFFVVGRDLEDFRCVELFRQAVAEGHAIANHSYSHHLGFRALPPRQFEQEIRACDSLIRSTLPAAPVGFRAPGYGWRRDLLPLLARLGYQYDSSLMPSPFGPVLRLADALLQHQPVPGKTQFPRLIDTLNWLSPQAASQGEVAQLPVAACPDLRLPWQAGICMALGRSYFQLCFSGFRRRPDLPGIFLMHAADLADLSGVSAPFFRQSRFFARPIAEREALAEDFLRHIVAHRPVLLTEDWLPATPG